MGQKDITEKQLEDYNDVFADIYNVLVFEKNIIDENRLQDGATESRYKDSNGINRDQRRDVMKTYLDEYRMELAFVGIDNQTEPDKYIPVRVLGYDYGKDFKLVARFFKNRRLGVKEWNDKTQIHHVEAFLDFIAAFANDSRYQSMKEDLEKIKAKGEKTGMDPYYDILIGNKVKKGEALGEEKMAKLIEYLLANGTKEEMQRAVSDERARAEMYEKYGIEEALKVDKEKEIIGAK